MNKTKRFLVVFNPLYYTKPKAEVHTLDFFSEEGGYGLPDQPHIDQLEVYDHISPELGQIVIRLPDSTPLYCNGIISWAKTHHEIVAAITKILKRGIPWPEEIRETMDSQGFVGMYSVAMDWTNEFEQKHQGREWDGEFSYEIWDFIKQKTS